MQNGSAILAMYDVRGIQSFIFRTNQIVDIIGASQLVMRVLEDGFLAWREERGGETSGIIGNWYTQADENPYALRHAAPLRFFSDIAVQAEVLYLGGGNLLVLYRNNELAEDANRFLARYVMKHTYSLNLACATVAVSSNYEQDRVLLMRRMERVKAEAAPMRPVGGFPFTLAEVVSGLPVYTEVRIRPQDPDLKRISKETSLKRDAYNAHILGSFGRRFCMRLDDMVADTRGDQNYLAVIHMDGNSMGERITQLLTGIADYPTAVNTMRALSLRISDTYERIALGTLESDLRSELQLADDKPLPLRPIIMAGDDLTFVCRADLAINIVDKLLRSIERYSMVADDDKSRETYRFSACAGITYMHSHFPFSLAYEMAEELCANAKKRAKEQAGKQNGIVGSFVDFHLCYSGVVADIATIRDTQYVNAEGDSLLLRPYQVGRGEIDEIYTLHSLSKKVERLRSPECPRSWVKQARDAYHATKTDVEMVFLEAASRENRYLALTPKGTAFSEHQEALYYDAMEMLDLFGDVKVEESNHAV